MTRTEKAWKRAGRFVVSGKKLFTANGSEFCKECIYILSTVLIINSNYFPKSRSQWQGGLRYGLPSFAQTLGSWVRIPLKAWMSTLCPFILRSPTSGMDICASLVCVCVAQCEGSGLAMGWSLVQGVLPSMWKRLQNWRRVQGPTKTCRAIKVSEVVPVLN
jgi:hypothetical protein